MQLDIQQLSDDIHRQVREGGGPPTSVQLARQEDFEALENDLSDDDKLELNSTWRKDWRSELYATKNNAEHALIARVEGVQGFVVFGNTVVTPAATLVWMLQSASFARSAHDLLGPRLAYIFKRSIQAVTHRLLQDQQTIFNFIPATQTRNIRWLRQQGFAFYTNPAPGYDKFFLFGMGPLMPAFSHDQRLWTAMLG